MVTAVPQLNEIEVGGNLAVGSLGGGGQSARMVRQRFLAEILEPLRGKAPFAHDRVDDNAMAHLTSLLFHPSLTVPVVNGSPVLGTWQSLFLVELDGPRQRTLRVTLTGE